MKADTLPSTGSTAVANSPSDYLKPVLTPANAPGLPTSSGPTGPAPPPPGPELALNVECGPNKAWFYVGRLCQGSKGPCVLFNGAWLTPNEFQYVSGRETAKDWKRSIRHHGKSMKLLMTKGILAISPPLCQCDVCTGCAENNNNLDVNKRAAEIAARKAAAEAAAAGLEATDKTTTGTSELSSNMADNSIAADRLADVDGGSDQNSPAKESRLTNIIEAIKSKKKKDDGPSDSSAQKENRPNSRPSSRSGTKKKKDQVMENGVGSPEELQPQNSPITLMTLDGPQGQRPEITLYPVVNPVVTATPSTTTTTASVPPSAPVPVPVPIPIAAALPPSVTVSVPVPAPVAVPVPASAPAPLPVPIQPTEVQHLSTTTNENDISVEAPKDDQSDSDNELPDDVIPDDVSRTRAYDWSKRHAKKLHQPQDACQKESVQRQITSTATVYPINHPASSSSAFTPSQSDSLQTSTSPALQHSLANHIRSLASRDTIPSQSEANLSQIPQVPPNMGQVSPAQGRWSPTATSKVMSGTDTKPPLLSANRSITTATPCITKPIVSTGSAMFSSPQPKDQRESSGRCDNIKVETKEETSKVYAPINWPPVASVVNTDARSTESTKPSTNSESSSKTNDISSSMRVAELSKSSETKSAAERHLATPEKERPATSTNGGDDRSRPSPPTPKVGVKASEVPPTSNYSEYLRHLGRLPGAPPPGMDDEAYIAMMRRYYEWYELSRLYGPYAVPGAAPSSSPALPRSSLPPQHPSAYDQHSLLSMYHPYYYGHAAMAGDPYRAIGATASTLPQDWARLSALSEQEREALIARQRAEAEGDSATAATSAATSAAAHGLKRPFPGEMSREEALDLSVNKKAKLAETLAARESAALFYGLHASGFRHPHYAAMGAHGAGYPAGMGSLELAAAYPGLWGLPLSHPGASLSHAIPTTGASLPHPGLAAYVSPHALAGSRPSTTAPTATSSAASTMHKELLHAAHRPEGPTLGLAGAWR